MYLISRSVLTLVILFCSAQNVRSQINRSRSFIIGEFGNDFTSGVTDDGMKYIKYEKTKLSPKIGSFTEVSVFYFAIIKNKGEVCISRSIFNPASLATEWFSMFKISYLELSKYLYMDYKNNLLFSIAVDDVLCEIEVTAGTK